MRGTSGATSWRQVRDTATGCVSQGRGIEWKTNGRHIRRSRRRKGERVRDEEPTTTTTSSSYYYYCYYYYDDDDEDEDEDL